MSINVRAINPDIEKERKSASFDVEEFAVWWNDGPEKLKEKRELEAALLQDPELREDGSLIYKSYQDLYDHSIKITAKLARRLKQLQDERNPGGSNIFPFFLVGGIGGATQAQGSPILLHFAMFVPTLQGQGTPEQVAKWVPKANKCEILGTFAQTELGHGTFLRGLETRADYDDKTEEFVLHSPKVTSYKWWPGGLGHTVNYAIVVAQLYIRGVQHGIQMFLVQLRDEETHMPLPGIIIGDIGNKMAFQTVNNGYLGFNKHRIPRTNMLMKNAQVFADGTFRASPTSVLAYLPMVRIRVVIVRTSFILLTRAATIAIRYSAVRRQSLINPNEPEPQIIDHFTQQMKLFTHLAKGVLLKLSFDYLNLIFEDLQKDLQNGEFTRLAELHALCSCLKAVSTKDASIGIETLRLACGGHGYMLASGLPIIYNFATAACTYEGDNTVLLLQTARYLTKAWNLAINGEKLAPTVAYLSSAVSRTSFHGWDGSWECIARALQFVAANKVRTAFNHLEERKSRPNMTPEEATNLTSIELVAAAEMHARSFFVSTALDRMRNIKVSEQLKTVLNDLLELYIVNECLEVMKDIQRFIGIREKDINDLQYRLEEALTRIRPNAVAIVDGFDYHDDILKSVLGAYDGNAYERIFESAKDNPMNHVSVQKSFEEYLKPLMRAHL